MLLLLLACSGKGDPPGGDDTGTTPIDLVSPVPEGQARAGVLTDPAALIGGIAGESQPGDLMLKNARVRFVVQAAREGHWYIQQGGGVIDADLARAAGEPGQDLLDEHMPMAGIGRLPVAQTVTVLADGRDGGPAIVRAEGPAEPMQLVLGSAESDALLPTAEMWITTDYILEPDAWLLRMETRVEWRDTAGSVELGDLALVSFEAGTVWRPGAGFDDDADGTGAFVAIVAEDGPLALGLFPDAEAFTDSPLQAVLGSIGQVLIGMGAAQAVAEGESVSWRRWLGVGPDLATLSGAWWEARGVAVEALSGRVLDETGAPVAGARVHLRDAEGAPLTQAWTGTDGRWSAAVPVGAVVDTVASGRGRAIVLDVAEGSSLSGPYADEGQNERARASLRAGGGEVAARGYGVSAAAAPGQDLVLQRPGWLVVSCADQGPAKVEVAFAEGDPVATDQRLVPGRPSGRQAEGYLAQGELRIPVEPGRYALLVHRGARHSYHQQQLEVAAGETVRVEATIEPAWEVAGVLAGDPHSHAAPSNDASVSMELRLLSQAAHGLDLHFGTDHDHVVDYSPLLEPLGLSGRLRTVVADEVSPPLRGHFNTWPLTPALDEPNHGSVLWWRDWRELGSTEGLFAAIRAMHGAAGGIIQANHPTSSGLVQASGYDREAGTIGNGNRWSSDFDAIEVINAGSYADVLPYYLDMVARGLHPLPVGVSDAHGADSSTGQSFTWMDLGVDQAAAVTDDDLRAMAAARASVASTGPFIDARIVEATGESWAPGRTVAGPIELRARVRAPDWMIVDRLILLRDGEEVERREASGEQAFTLAPEADAFYVLLAEGDAGMSPVYPGRRPWAMTAALRVDADGDGTWTPSRPALVVR